jgi:hypothetical protein
MVEEIVEDAPQVTVPIVGVPTVIAGKKYE